MSLEQLQLILVLLSEVLELLLGVRDDGGLAGLPVGGADLGGVGVGELERLDQPEGLVHGPAHGQVVHGDLPEDPVAVNDEEAPEGVAHLFQVDPVVLADRVGGVAQQGKVQLPDPALRPLDPLPGQVGEGRVHADPQDLGVELPELRDPVVEGQQLGRADEGEGVGDEDQDQVLALEVAQADLAQLPVDHPGALEVGGRLHDQGLGPLHRVTSRGIILEIT